MKKKSEGKPVTRERILKTIGLSYRAGLMTSGFEAIELALHAGAVSLLILAKDGSDKQREKLRRIAKEEDTMTSDFATAEELGGAIGKPSRIAIAILDEGMAKKLHGQIEIVNEQEASADQAE